MADNLRQMIEKMAKGGVLKDALVRVEFMDGGSLYGKTNGVINEEGKLIFLEPTGSSPEEAAEMQLDIPQMKSFEVKDAHWAAYYLNALSLQLSRVNTMMRAHRQ